MSTATKLQSILDSKASIKQALINRGYKSEEVGDILSQYGYLIENISTGGGELETAISDAKYDYIKEYLIDMIAESYEITKDWIDYSQASRSNIWFLPQLDFPFGGFVYSPKILFMPKGFTNYRNSISITNNDRLLFIDFGDTLNGKVSIFFNGIRNNWSLIRVTGFEIVEGGNYTFCFDGSRVLEFVEGKSLGAATTYHRMFSNCRSLKFINGIIFDFTNIENKSDADMFFNCASLQEVRFKENTLKVDLDMSYSTLLSHDSLLSIINSCSQVSETQTLKLGEANLAKLSEEEKAIATNKGWTLA